MAVAVLTAPLHSPSWLSQFWPRLCTRRRGCRSSDRAAAFAVVTPHAHSRPHTLSWPLILFPVIITTNTIVVTVIDIAVVTDFIITQTFVVTLTSPQASSPMADPDADIVIYTSFVSRARRHTSCVSCTFMHVTHSCIRHLHAVYTHSQVPDCKSDHCLTSAHPLSHHRRPRVPLALADFPLIVLKNNPHDRHRSVTKLLVSTPSLD